LTYCKYPSIHHMRRRAATPLKIFAWIKYQDITATWTRALPWPAPYRGLQRLELCSCILHRSHQQVRCQRSFFQPGRCRVPCMTTLFPYSRGSSARGSGYGNSLEGRMSSSEGSEATMRSLGGALTSCQRWNGHVRDTRERD
jgi:hypothetical protein